MEIEDPLDTHPCGRILGLVWGGAKPTVLSYNVSKNSESVKNVRDCGRMEIKRFFDLTGISRKEEGKAWGRPCVYFNVEVIRKDHCISEWFSLHLQSPLTKMTTPVVMT